LHSDGSLDESFNPGADSLVTAFALQADGQILVGGHFATLGGQPRAWLGRLSPDGILDQSFNPGANDWITAIAVQTDGKILVAGAFTMLGGLPRQRLGRLHANGALETSFGFDIDDAVVCLAVVPGGDILFGGRFARHLERLDRGPTVDIALNHGAPPGVTLSWRCFGVLLHADDLSGPWEPVPDASNPFTPSANVSKRFYRLELPGPVWRDIWTGVPGTQVEDIPLNLPPDRTDRLNQLESPPGYGDLYGVRLRAVITAPASGNYTFWVASDDGSALWLSPDESSANQQRIASVPGWTNFREWEKYPEQRSAAVTLVEGQRYYVEALMKEHSGGDHLSVGWARPGEPTSIPSELVPFSVLNPPFR
jgi:hypothetical protein